MLKFEMDASHYQTHSILAQCCDEIATVHVAHHLPSGTFVAVKKFRMDASTEEDSLIQQEIILARQLQHPNLLTYCAAFVSGPDLYVVTPLMSFGSCRDLLDYQFPEGLPEPIIAFILRDVLQALDYLHRKGYIHRAIRASHILVSSSGQVCLSGLRYAAQIIQKGQWQRSIHSLPKLLRKNLNWLSPEMLAQNLHGYNEKSDMYSVGMTSCELANSVVPFWETATTVMLTEKIRGVAPPLLDCTTVPTSYEDVDAGTEQPLQITHHPDSGVGDSVASSNNVHERMKAFAQRRFSEPFHHLTELCIQHDPQLRPSANQMLAHSFFKQCRRGGHTLAELLRHVADVTERRLNDHDEVAITMTEKMSELDIEPVTWDF